VRALQKDAEVDLAARAPVCCQREERLGPPLLARLWISADHLTARTWACTDVHVECPPIMNPRMGGRRALLWMCEVENRSTCIATKKAMENARALESRITLMPLKGLFKISLVRLLSRDCSEEGAVPDPPVTLKWQSAMDRARQASSA
jgi:hypothetical protein